MIITIRSHYPLSGWYFSPPNVITWSACVLTFFVRQLALLCEFSPCSVVSHNLPLEWNNVDIIRTYYPLFISYCKIDKPGQTKYYLQKTKKNDSIPDKKYPVFKHVSKLI